MPSRLSTPSKSSPRIIARYHNDHTVSKKDSTARYSNHWDTWYDAFVAEVKEEFPNYTSTQLRKEAESRWLILAAKSLKTSHADILTWLNSPSPRAM